MPQRGAWLWWWSWPYLNKAAMQENWFMWRGVFGRHVPPSSFHATISHCILCLRSTVLGGLTRKRVGAGSCGGGDVVASSFPPQKKGRSINTYSREYNACFSVKINSIILLKCSQIWTEIPICKPRNSAVAIWL